MTRQQDAILCQLLSQRESWSEWEQVKSLVDNMFCIDSNLSLQVKDIVDKILEIEYDEFQRVRKVFEETF